MMSNVIHPGHYNIPGRKECIEEMLEKFGYEKTEAFCELNSYKYQYRHEQKNGQEDLDKAATIRICCSIIRKKTQDSRLLNTLDWKVRRIS